MFESIHFLCGKKSGQLAKLELIQELTAELLYSYFSGSGAGEEADFRGS